MLLILTCLSTYLKLDPNQVGEVHFKKTKTLKYFGFNTEIKNGYCVKQKALPRDDIIIVNLYGQI